jgi:formiminoglutamase
LTKLLNTEYEPAQKKYWSGRKSNPDIGNQYWHQEIELLDIKDIGTKNTDIALLGYVCDEGVRRNSGRIGANQGPTALRERLAKLPIHFDAKKVADYGNIICVDEDMEACQTHFANTIESFILNGVFPIAIGGGHDMSYGHFKGIYKATNKHSKKKIGIINFDAHFDLRPVEEKSSSGTPFNQILNEFENTTYFAIGIQRQSNTKELFEIAKNDNINFAVNYDCESSKEELNALQKRLQPMIDSCDYVYITIDLDGFSSAYAPGVSAPSPLGFTPYFVFKMLRFLFDTNKVISCDVAELNPTLDRDNLTANLAAKLVDFMVMKLANKKSQF